MIRLLRRAVGLALWHLGYAEPDRTPVQAAHIEYLAVHAIYDELDDRNEGVR